MPLDRPHRTRRQSVHVAGLGVLLCARARRLLEAVTRLETARLKADAVAMGIRVPGALALVPELGFFACSAQGRLWVL